MASSSPLSEPPSSPPRTPSRDRSRKRGSYDPSTPRTARRLRSTTPRPGPATARSPGREGSKGKGKEVVTPLTLKNCGPLVANVISQLGGQPIGDEDEYEDFDEDSDESEQTSPTPAAAKNKGPLSMGEKVSLEADRVWSALELEEAHQEVLGGLDKLTKKVDMVNLKAVSRHDYVLEEIQECYHQNKERLDSLTTSAAASFAALNKRVGEITSRPPPNTFERGTLRPARQPGPEATPAARAVGQDLGQG